MTYSEISRSHQSTIIRRTNDDGSYSWIPKCPTNTDYAAYLAWVEEGNMPAPAPAPPVVTPPTPAEKLKAAGLTVEELKALLAS